MRSCWLGLLALVFGLFAPAAQADDGVLAGIKKSGVLRIGATGDYLPYTVRKPDGALVGADVEMAEDLAKALGVKAEFVPTTWKSLADDMKAGKFDIAVGGVTITPDRALIADFSVSQGKDGKRPIVRCADKDRLTTVAAIDQPNVRVVVNPGGTNERFVREFIKSAPITVWEDNRTIFDRIAEGHADVMVTDGIEVDLQVVRHPGALCAANVADTFTKFEKAYWLRRDPAFKQAVDAWMTEAMANGKWKRFLEANLK